MQQFPSIQNKSLFRKKCKMRRLELLKEGELASASKKLTEIIAKSDYFLKAKNVMLFYPLKDEINLLDLLKFDKNFYFPRCFNNEILCCPYVEGDFECGSYNIKEPKTEPLKNLNQLDLIIVPALCADKKGNRLGYGKGFYDRFLKNEAIKAKKIAAVLKDLYFNEIPVEEFDIKMDKIFFA